MARGKPEIVEVYTIERDAADRVRGRLLSYDTKASRALARLVGTAIRTYDRAKPAQATYLEIVATADEWGELYRLNRLWAEEMHAVGIPV